jgi:hypothetical protein
VDKYMKIGFLSISIIAVIATMGSCGNMGSIQQTPGKIAGTGD